MDSALLNLILSFDAYSWTSGIQEGKLLNKQKVVEIVRVQGQTGKVLWDVIVFIFPLRKRLGCMSSSLIVIVDAESLPESISYN